MAFEDEHDFEVLKNEAEHLIIRELGEQLEVWEKGICRCDECVVDMAAMALNSVKPLYRVSLLGTLHAAQAMNDPVYADSVRNAVSNAIEKISSNPSHD
jgi:competence protein ComFB